jgi:hypothetical protein
MTSRWLSVQALRSVSVGPGGSSFNPGPQAWARRLSWVLLVAGVVAFILLSAPALLVLGIPYDAPEGSFPAKIHLGTYLLLPAWILGLAGQGHPLEALWRQARQHRAVFTYLVCMTVVFLWAAGQHGPSGLAFIIDTLIMPAVAVLTVLLQPRHRQRQLLQLIMFAIVANALLGIAESALRMRVVPIYAGREKDFVEEPFFRASAMFGHPLQNSLVTLSLLPMLLLMPWRAGWKVATVVLCLLSLLAFGSRTALAVALIYALLFGLVVVWRLVRGRYGYVQIAAGALGMVVGSALLAAVVAVSGLGARIFKNLTWDNSADVRLKSWDVLDHVHGAEVWFGVSMLDIASIAERIGIDPRYEAIENFWLVMLLLLGVLGFVAFVVGLVVLFTYLWRISAAPMRVALVMYLLVASGANTLSSKNVSLLLLVMAVQCAAVARVAPQVDPLRRRLRSAPGRSFSASTSQAAFSAGSTGPRPTGRWS